MTNLRIIIMILVVVLLVLSATLILKINTATEQFNTLYSLSSPSITNNEIIEVEPFDETIDGEAIIEENELEDGEAIIEEDYAQDNLNTETQNQANINGASSSDSTITDISLQTSNNEITNKSNSNNKNNNTNKTSSSSSNISNTKITTSNSNKTTTNTTTKQVASTLPYYIKVNKTQNVVNIYTKDADGDYTVPFKAMICSTGTSTPRAGNKYKITTYRRTWNALKGNVYGQYAVQIVGNILFHSVPYTTKNNYSLEYWEYDKLGTKASAGCIRLTVQDAKWIYDNVSAGTWVEFYEDEDPGPLGKPSAKIISNNELCRDWDPTDYVEGNPWHIANIEVENEIDLINAQYTESGNQYDDSKENYQQDTNNELDANNQTENKTSELETISQHENANNKIDTPTGSGEKVEETIANEIIVPQSEEAKTETTDDLFIDEVKIVSGDIIIKED